MEAQVAVTKNRGAIQRLRWGWGGEGFKANLVTWEGESGRQSVAAEERDSTPVVMHRTKRWWGEG